MDDMDLDVGDMGSLVVGELERVARLYARKIDRRLRHLEYRFWYGYWKLMIPYCLVNREFVSVYKLKQVYQIVSPDKMSEFPEFARI